MALSDSRPDPGCPELSRLDTVERQLAAALRCEDPAANGITGYLLKARGKRLRPLLVLLAAAFCRAGDEAVTPVAAAAELVHMASLVHDDILDESPERRGEPSLHVSWGRHRAVLAGDFLFARAFSLLVEHRQYHALHQFSTAIADMCEAEMAQNHFRFDPDIAEADYLEWTRKKTASLFVACCLAGAGPGSRECGTRACLEDFGRYFGMAFQLTDDLLDFTSTAGLCGKPVAADLPRGVITLPVVYLLKDEARSEPVRRLLRARRIDAGEWSYVRGLVVAAGALEAASGVAHSYAVKAREALAALPPLPQRRYLEELCGRVLERRH
jgi:heptaprenyl diphosphate synthase